MQVGQKVYLKDLYSNRNRETEVQEFEIKSIGWKYIYVIKNGLFPVIEKFDKETLRHFNKPYSPMWELRFSLQEIEEEKEYNSLFEEMRDTFNGYRIHKLNLDQLRQIKGIIDGEEVE